MRSTGIPRSHARVLLGVVVLALAGTFARAQTGRPTPPRARPKARPAVSAPRVERSVPFRQGERLTYDIAWSKYLTAGTATMTVREKRPSYDSVAYYIVVEGRTTGVLSSLYSLYYKADTLLDVYTLLPQRGALFSLEGKRSRLKVTRFHQATGRGEYEVKTATLVKRSVRVPPMVQDGLSAIYVLRAIRLREGDRFAMPVCDSGSNFRVMFEVGKREPVRTPMGTVTAFRVTPTLYDASRRPVGGPLRIWISDDARRLPVKVLAELAVGSVNLTLREVR